MKDLMMWRYVLSGMLIVSAVIGLIALDDATNRVASVQKLRPSVVAPVAPVVTPNQPVVATIVPPRPVQPLRPTITEPDMVPIFGSTYQMGSTEDASEQPVHKVTVSSFLLAKRPVTVRQWRECVQANACTAVLGADDDAPVNNVSWTDAQRYVTWLVQVTHRAYRLPSEAEWEYAVRAGTETRYWWGNTMKPGFAVCKGCGQSDADRPANPFGLRDINSGITEWVEDCWTKDYRGAAIDGSARIVQDCRERVLRGGAWSNDPSYIRSASRDHYDASVRYPTHGFRVALSP